MPYKRDPSVDAARSALMARVRREGTTPERIVRSALHRTGLRFRLNVRDLPGSPDLVFPARRAVLFVHGCFWHRHVCCARRLPKTRTEYWRAKFERNVERDKYNQESLVAAGWRVFVIWECEANQLKALTAVTKALRKLPKLKRKRR